jgi:hypothetical protein
MFSLPHCLINRIRWSRPGGAKIAPRMTVVKNGSGFTSQDADPVVHTLPTFGLAGRGEVNWGITLDCDPVKVGCVTLGLFIDGVGLDEPELGSGSLVSLGRPGGVSVVDANRGLPLSPDEGMVVLSSEVVCEVSGNVGKGSRTILFRGGSSGRNVIDHCPAHNVGGGTVCPTDSTDCSTGTFLGPVVGPHNSGADTSDGLGVRST